MKKIEAEKLSIFLLLSLKDKIESSIDQGILERDAYCGIYAVYVENLIWAFFDNEREEVCISRPSSLMKISNLISFIDDVVLESFNKKRSDVIYRDWQNRWTFSEEEA